MYGKHGRDITWFMYVVLQDVMELVNLTSSAAERYAACVTEVDKLGSCSFPADAVPQQLRSLEDQLRQQLEVRWLLVEVVAIMVAGSNCQNSAVEVVDLWVPHTSMSAYSMVYFTSVPAELADPQHSTCFVTGHMRTGCISTPTQNRGHPQLSPANCSLAAQPVSQCTYNKHFCHAGCTNVASACFGPAHTQLSGTLWMAAAFGTFTSRCVDLAAGFEVCKELVQL